MRFANDFHSWLRHSWKLLANRLTRDPKIVIHGNSCIILYILIMLRKFMINGVDEYISLTHANRPNAMSWQLLKPHNGFFDGDECILIPN